MSAWCVCVYSVWVPFHNHGRYIPCELPARPSPIYTQHESHNHRHVWRIGGDAATQSIRFWLHIGLCFAPARPVAPSTNNKQTNMPPAKRSRTDGGADARLDALLADVPVGNAATVLLIAAMEWDTANDAFTSEGKPATDFFERLQPFVLTLESDEDSVAKELFEEALAKSDDQALEEVGFLKRSGVIDEDEEARMRDAAVDDRRRMLFVSLLADSEKPEDDEGEEDEGEDGVNDGEEGEEDVEGDEEDEEDEEEGEAEDEDDGEEDAPKGEGDAGGTSAAAPKRRARGA
jgi:hypothetical protein